MTEGTLPERRKLPRAQTTDGRDVLVGPTSSEHGIARMVSSVVLGRDDELALLREQLDAVARGQCRVAIVAGEPGIGKTTLIAEFLRESKRVIPAIAVAECLELESALPYAPFLAILDRLASLSPGAAAASDQVRSLLSAVAGSRLALTERSQIDSAWARLVTVAARSPLVIVVEDLHWADDASIELLLYLARKVAHDPVLLLASLRTSEPDPLRRVERARVELLRRSSGSEIAVGPLARAATSAVIRALLHLDAPPDRDFAERLHDRSGGNPLLTEEILRDLVDRAIVFRRDGAWHRREPLWEGVAPPSVASTVSARLDVLPPDAQAILTAAAVLGPRFEYETLLRFTDGSAQSVLAGLKAGIASQLIEEERGTGGYRFRHALLRDAVEDRLLMPERRALHRLAAEALERHASHAELANHYALAGDPTRETVHRLEAATLAMRTMSYSDALRHGERLLEIAPEGSIRDDFFVRLMPAVQEVANIERSVRFAERSRDFYARQGDEVFRGRCVAWSGTLYAARGEWDRHIASQIEAIRILEPFGDTLHLANTLANLSDSAPDATEALALAERCLSISLRVGTVREVVRGHFFVGRALLRLDRSEEGIEALRRCVDAARRAGPEDLARTVVINHLEFASRVLAWVPQMAVERRRLSEECVALAGKYGTPHLVAKGVEDRLALEAGRWDDCLNFADELRSVQLAGKYVAGFDVRDRWMHWLRRGGSQADRDDFERRRADAATLGDWQPASLWGSALALAVGDAQWALACAEPARLRIDPGVTNAVGVYALSAAALLKDPDAFERWTVAPREGPRDAPAVQGRLRYADAERAMERGDAGTAATRLAESAELFKDYGDKIVELFVRQRRVEVLARDGKTGLASAEVEPIVDYWKTAKAHWYLDQMRQRLRPLGVEIAEERVKTRESAQGPLTRREREVALLVADGLTDKEIADRLGLSRRTAESHVERIRTKLGFTSRAQIAAWVVKRSRTN